MTAVYLPTTIFTNIMDFCGRNYVDTRKHNFAKVIDVIENHIIYRVEEIQSLGQEFTESYSLITINQNCLDTKLHALGGGETMNHMKYSTHYMKKFDRNWDSWFKNHAPNHLKYHNIWIDKLEFEELDHPDDLLEAHFIDLISFLKTEKCKIFKKLMIKANRGDYKDIIEPYQNPISDMCV